jgi:uncharacterized protein (TIGR03435 family)
MSWKIYRQILLLCAATAPAWPQARFEVASVRPSQPGMTARDGRANIHGDRFEIKAYTVGDILDMLGGWQLFRVAGGPDWMRTDRYDIEAKADRPLEARDRNAAVMALLAERFQLQSHSEQREVPGIVLRAPKTPGGLKQSNAGESYSIRMDRGDVIFTAVPMSGLTNYLSQMLRAPVVDETQLNGAYTFQLATSKIEAQQGLSFGDRVREAAEAIGFRLENRKVPLEVTVVDRCERPTAN